MNRHKLRMFEKEVLTGIGKYEETGSDRRTEIF
jgi:hypothetical protein